jgi:hypothetical protein
VRIITYGKGGFDPTKPNNNIISDVEVPDPPQQPLEGTPLVATLNAVLGVWTLEQAANIAQLPAEALVAEAEAWAVAGNG